MLLIHQVVYLVDHGVPVLTAAALGGVTGMVSIGGKIGWGTLSDRTPAAGLRPRLPCVVASIGGLVLAGWYPTPTPAPVRGPHRRWLCGHGSLPRPSRATCSRSGFLDDLRALYTVSGFGLAAGTWSAGWIFDLTGSYAGALWLGLVMAMLSPLLMWMATRAASTRSPAEWTMTDSRSGGLWIR